VRLRFRGALPIQKQQIERDEDPLPFSENQVAKFRPAGVVQAADLAIEDGAINAKMFGDPSSKVRESAENVSISGDQSCRYAYGPTRECRQSSVRR
jgi:hypothetical protein